MTDDSPGQLVDHFFRQESGKLIAVLSRVFGFRHFELVEDMVQSALLEALRAWQTGIPEKPAAWIHRVAKNKILDAIRRDKAFATIAERIACDENEHDPISELFDESQLQDSVLRMMFACCHPSLPADSSIPLTLKTICGFGEKEIARGLLLSPENVRKRIYRARQHLIREKITLEIPSSHQLSMRLEVVHNVLYLMFNEGYACSSDDQAIRQDVCEEAARLCHLLTEHPQCSTQTTFALLALMLFHACRFQSRMDQEGALILLEEQDRAQWDRRLMARAFDYFQLATVTNEPSKYHFEAAIAMYHCKARTFAETNWSAIISLYDRLIESRPLAIYHLNRAIAVGQKDGPAPALRLLDQIRDDPYLRRSHLLDAAFAELYSKAGQKSKAVVHFQAAIDKTESPHDRALLLRRLKTI